MLSLNKSEFVVSENLKPVLDSAIAELSFPGQRDEFKSLSKQIYSDLWKLTTLLVLNGLDEATEVGDVTIRHSLDLNWATIFLSHPCNLQPIYLTIDISLECLGMTICGSQFV